jgi:uncharacterized membrane protein
MKKVIPLIIIGLSFIVAFLIFPLMPPMMASHWGVGGEVNGYMSRFWGLFFMPILSIFLYLLFRFLPSTDPYRKNFKEFENYYDNFVVVILSFLFYIYLLTLIWNLGHKFNMMQFMSPAFAVLFYFAGILTSHAHQNWFVGIRTPWTLSNKVVWQKTHAIGGKLFKLTALLILFGTGFPQYAFYLLLVPIIFTTVFVFVYSYWVFLGQA